MPVGDHALAALLSLALSGVQPEPQWSVPSPPAAGLVTSAVDGRGRGGLVVGEVDLRQEPLVGVDLPASSTTNVLADVAGYIG